MINTQMTRILALLLLTLVSVVASFGFNHKGGAGDASVTISLDKSAFVEGIDTNFRMTVYVDNVALAGSGDINVSGTGIPAGTKLTYNADYGYGTALFTLPAVGGPYAYNANISMLDPTDPNGINRIIVAAPEMSFSVYHVTITAPADNAVIAADSTFTLSAVLGNPLGSPISHVEFFVDTKDGERFAFGAEDPITHVWSFTVDASTLAIGAHTIYAKVYDFNGKTSFTAGKSITINALPTVTITAPAANTSYADGTTSITLAATASDPDAEDTITVTFTVKDTEGTAVYGPQTVTGAAGVYSTDWTTGITPGYYTFEAEAADNHGVPSIIASVGVIVECIGQVQYRISNADSYEEVPASFKVLIGTTVNFKALPIFGSSWPTGTPEWGGVASGTGETKSVAFTTAGEKLLTVKCGT